MLLEDLVQFLLVGDVRRVVLGPLAADELNAVEHLFGGVVEVVNDDDLVVGLEESESSERADVAGATGRMFVLAAHTMPLLLLVGCCRGASHRCESVLRSGIGGRGLTR